MIADVHAFLPVSDTGSTNCTSQVHTHSGEVHGHESTLHAGFKVSRILQISPADLSSDRRPLAQMRKAVFSTSLQLRRLVLLPANYNAAALHTSARFQE